MGHEGDDRGRADAATTAAPDAQPEPDAVADEPRRARAAAPQTSADTEATGTDIPSQDEGPAPREGFLARLKGWWHTGTWAARSPAAEPAAARRPRSSRRSGPERRAPSAEPPSRAEQPEPDPELEGLLVAVLDDLGSAHHRPFSRA